MSDTGIFDPSTFLNESVGGSMSTERVLVPANTYRGAYIKDLKPMGGTISKGERTGRPWAALLITWVIDDQAAREATNRAEVTLNQMLMLDLDDNDKLDTRKGRNVRLGKLRKALGLNEGNETFAQFIGRPVTIQVEHRNDKNGNPTEEVVAFASN